MTKLLRLYWLVTGDNSVGDVPVAFSDFVEKCIRDGELSDTEIKCLTEVYINGRTLQDVADEIGCTRENVRQRGVSAIRHIRSVYMESKEITWDTPLSDIVFSKRAENAIASLGIQTVGQLAEVLHSGKKIRGVGVKTTRELYDKVYVSLFYIK